MINLEEIKGLNEKELLSKLYGKKLETKKNVLEYIELTRVLKQDGVPKSLIQNTYDLIDESIDNMAGTVKPNTIMHLKNQLKGQLGKLVDVNGNKNESNFIKFFKCAYPEGSRNKNFTYVLMDNNKISSEQIWTTLTYINRECIKGNLRLTNADRKEIKAMIQKLFDKKDIKYVNRVKSMDKLLRVLDVTILTTDNGFNIKKNK